MYQLHNIQTDKYTPLSDSEALNMLHESYPVINTNVDAKIMLFSLLNDKSSSIPVIKGYISQL